MFSKSLAVFLLAGVAASVISNPSAQTLPSRGSVRFYPDDPLRRDDDMRSIAEPAEHDLSKSYEFIANTFGETARSFGPALNMNTLGEVPDSSWFTNRIGQSDMTVDEVLRGPNQVDGPAPGQWLVTGRPESGITPKFTIRDGRGDTYMIKLDPPSNPELPSSVELISTKLFHAIGYHVPQDFVVHFRPDQLVVAPGARIRDAVGKRVPIQQSDIHRWLRNVPTRVDGSIRALASLWVPGKVVGQFTFNGRRPDDPNDAFPHERRRELRALRVFAAWLNHDDARSINSIDTYIEEDGRRYIRHYLQDFGSNLGSGSTSAQQPRGGYEYLVEPGKIGKGLIGLGFYRRDWMSITWPHDPSIGNIEADVFDPATWKTEYPNSCVQADGCGGRFLGGKHRVAVHRRHDPRGRGRSTTHESRCGRATSLTSSSSGAIRPCAGESPEQPPGPIRSAQRQAPELAFENAAVRLRLVNQHPEYEIGWASVRQQRQGAGAVQATLVTVEPRAAIPPGRLGTARCRWSPVRRGHDYDASAGVSALD
jgi:hypothetical protein